MNKEKCSVWMNDVLDDVMWLYSGCKIATYNL